jgi:hypothetical protein
MERQHIGLNNDINAVLVIDYTNYTIMISFLLSFKTIKYILKAGQEKAKQALQELVILPALNPEVRL